MKSPTEIANSLDKEELELLGKILEIEKQYQHISKLSKQRNTEIADKLIHEIKKVAQNEN